MSDRALLEEVNTLKVRLERYIAENEDDKILRILGRLAGREIAFDSLKETGIGKVVNKLRKYDGEIGASARELVDYWKGMVQTSQSQDSSSRKQPLAREMRESVVSFVPTSSPSTSASSHRGKRKSPSPGSSQPSVSKRSQTERVDTAEAAREILSFSEDLLQDETLMRILREPYQASTSTAGSTSSQGRHTTPSNHLVGRNISRTKMFAGRAKAGTTIALVPSLMDLCIKVLTAHVNNIEEIGWVPYHVFKPVLVACSPAQLGRIEGFNRHLIEDSDELWKAHCLKEFKIQELDEEYDGDTFRDTFHRKLEEREQKLRNLTDNIKRNKLAREAPVRQTKMALVDTKLLTKGPRIPRDSFKPPAELSIREKMKRLNVPAPPARSRGGWGSSSGGGAVAVSKPKSGPLMQKSMKAFKNAFKR